MRMDINNWDEYGFRISDGTGSFTMINKHALRVDQEKYQRDSNDRVVARIAKSWSWVACGCLSVAQRSNGELWVLDGQHRLLAARQRPDIEDLPCLVFGIPNVQNEARAFVHLNQNRKGVSAIDKFKARLTTGDPVALEVKRLVESEGMRIGRGSTDSTRDVECVTAIEDMLTQKVYSDVIWRIWPLVCELCQGHRVQKPIIQGLCYIERWMPEGESIMDPRLRNKILRIGYDVLTEAARREAALLDNRNKAGWAKGLLKEINKGLHHKVRLVAGRLIES